MKELRDTSDRPAEINNMRGWTMMQPRSKHQPADCANNDDGDDALDHHRRQRKIADRPERSSLRVSRFGCAWRARAR